MGDYKINPKLPPHLKQLIATTIGTKALEYASSNMPTGWYDAANRVWTPTTSRRIGNGRTSSYGTKKPKRRSKSINYKQSYGVGGKSGSHHNHQKSRVVTKYKRRKKRKRRVPSNKTLANKVKKLEHRTRLSKYYIHIQGSWIRRDVADNATEYYNIEANDEDRIKSYLRNVPWPSTEAAAVGVMAQAYKLARGNRQSLIDPVNTTTNWNLNINSLYEFKNTCSMPVNVSIYWCVVQKDTKKSPINYINEDAWRNRFYFSSEANKNSFGEGAARNNEDSPTSSQMMYPTHHKDLMNTWKPKRVYHGVVEPAGHVTAKASVGAITYNRRRWERWDAFVHGDSVGGGAHRFLKNLKSAFWLVRVEGIPVMDQDDVEDVAGNHGTRAVTYMDRMKTHVTLKYKVPGTTIVNHDYIDESAGNAMAQPVHPGRNLGNQAEEVEPQKPPEGGP